MGKKSYKLKKDKKTGETRIDYFYIVNKSEFRYQMLKKAISNEEEVLFSIDTNLIKEGLDSIAFSKEKENFFKENNISYRVIPTQSTKQKKIFGIRVGNANTTEFIILMILKVSLLTEDFYKEIFDDCDYIVGTGIKKSLEEISDDIQKGYADSIFSEDYVENALYDSIRINWIRMTKGFNVE